MTMIISKTLKVYEKGSMLIFYDTTAGLMQSVPKGAARVYPFQAPDVGFRFVDIRTNETIAQIKDYAQVQNEAGAAWGATFIDTLEALCIFFSESGSVTVTGTVNANIVSSDVEAGDITIFNERLTALRTSQMNFKPTWGVTAYRYKTTTTGAGATLSEINGEFRLQSGTAISTIAEIQTNQRGQYQAGAMAQVGIGFRIPTDPTGTQYAKWGYSDFVNSGFYFGVDVPGNYMAYITGGVETKVYQSAWNLDKLDGTGTSGLTLTNANGVISQIDFTWYGYGDIAFSFLIYNTTTKKTQKVYVHSIKINGSVSIIDPNQPLTFQVGNGASSTTDFSLYIGGHQFSTVDGFSTPQKRIVSELLTNYTTATNTNWQPILAIKKKTTLNGRPNSVNVLLENIEISADGEVETRITITGTTSNLAWATPTGFTATETAIETKITTAGTALTTATDGLPIDYGFVTAANKVSATFENDVSTVLGSDVEVILWIRRISAAGVIIVKHAHISWNEQW